jgi:hypothetical protein
MGDMTDDQLDMDARVEASYAPPPASGDGPGERSAALHEAWVRNGGDQYFGPLFWDEVVARFSEVAAVIESSPPASGDAAWEALWNAVDRNRDDGDDRAAHVRYGLFRRAIEAALTPPPPASGDAALRDVLAQLERDSAEDKASGMRDLGFRAIGTDHAIRMIRAALTEGATQP